MKNLFRRLFQGSQSSRSASRTWKGNAWANRLHLEELEGRLLLNSQPIKLRDGELSISGDDRDNVIDVLVGTASDQIDVIIDDDEARTFDIAGVRLIRIYGKGGDDEIFVDGEITLPVVIRAGRGDDTVTAGGGDSTIRGGRGSDDLLGGDGADYIRGRQGHDIIDGGVGNDTLHGGRGHDDIFGDEGDDHIRAARGRDSVDGGEGADSVNCAGNHHADVHADSDDLVKNCGAQNAVPDEPDEPQAFNDSFVINEDTTLNGTSVLNNDTADDELFLSAELVSAPLNAASFTLNADGTFTYTPTTNFNGTDSFTYVAVDDLGHFSNAATATIMVVSVNDAPVAANDSFDALENTTLNGTSVLVNDSDSHSGAPSENNLPLTAQLVTGPTQSSSFTLNTDGTFSYTPLTGFSGTDTFTYSAIDSLSGISNTATVTIQVGLVAVGDSFSVAEEGTLNGTSVLSNDSDNGFPPLTAQLVSGPSHASAFTLNGDGTFTYTPVADFNGTDTFTYRAENSISSVSNVATVTITITSVNDSPVASTDSFSLDEDNAISASVSGRVIDVDNNLPLSFQQVSGPLHASSFTLNSDGSFTYVPAGNFNGTDSFTYQAVDSLGAVSNTATVSLLVNSLNDPPLVVDDIHTVSEDSPLNGFSVLVNDSDFYDGAPSENNLPLTAQLVSGPSRAASFTLNSDGTFTYTPAADFNGTDSFTYQAVDSLGGVSGAATVTITVQSVNDAPLAADDAFRVNGDATLVGTSVLDNDSDSHDGAPSESNLPLTALLASGPSQAMAFTLNSDGTFTYTPTSGFNGLDTFTYQAADSLGGVSTLATVTIQIGLFAADDSASVEEDTTLSGTSVLDNDGDNGLPPLTAQLVSGPSHAAAFTLNSDGSFTYTPVADFNGSDNFTYQAVNILSNVSNTATVTITVNSVNDAPVAADDSYNVDEHSTLNGGSVLDNDSDSHDGAPSESNLPLTAQLVIGPGSALAFTLNSDGTFTYTPMADFTGTDGFTYHAVDALGGVSNVATVTIMVVAAP